MFPKDRQELNDYIARGKSQEMNLIILIKALKAIEGLTFEDICGSAEEKIGDIYTLAHHALKECAGCGCDQTKIISTYDAMVHFGTASKPQHRKVILPDGERVKCLV